MTKQPFSTAPAVDRRASRPLAASTVTIPLGAPWAWLAAGWRDLWAVPGVSMAYGATLATAALLIILGLTRFGLLSLFPALAGGTLLIAPFLGVGLYEASRRLAAGQPVTLRAVVMPGLAALRELYLFGLLLLMVFLVWVQIALLLMMLFLGAAAPPSFDTFAHDLLLTRQGLALLVVGSMVGGLLAALVFAMSALAVPHLLVTRVDAITAARLSLTTVVANPKPMALWAALIVVLMAASFATVMVGFVIAFPWIAHATWHAYADTLGRDTSSRSGDNTC